MDSDGVIILGGCRIAQSEIIEAYAKAANRRVRANWFAVHYPGMNSSYGWYDFYPDGEIRSVALSAP